jgi:hypothetical protein
MSPTDIPPDVARFLRANIRSVIQLEMLMLLRRDPERWWTAAELDQALRSSLEASKQNLRELVERGLVEANSDVDPRYRHRLADPSHEPLVAQVAGLFQTHFHALIHMIYSGRHRSVEDFANAFKIKSDNGNKNDG